MEALRREAANLQSSVVPFIQRLSTEILSGVGYLLPVILVPILTISDTFGTPIHHPVAGENESNARP